MVYEKLLGSSYLNLAHFYFIMIDLKAYVGTSRLAELMEECSQRTSFRRFERGGCSTINGFGGIHGSSKYFERALLRCILQDLPRGTFLDLGSSGGLVVIEAARENWAAYGIDLCQRCCSFARECICEAEQVGYIPKDRAIIIEGNFFPPHFQVIRSRGDDDPFEDPIVKHQRASTSDDPYARRRIALANINLFFHYQVERMDNIIRFFAQEA